MIRGDDEISSAKEAGAKYFLNQEAAKIHHRGDGLHFQRLEFRGAFIYIRSLERDGEE
jgi:hypothetical protein